MYGRQLKAWRRDVRGASAVEFALIVPLFFALIFSIIEVGYFYFVNTSVTEARVQLGRLVRTGQLQSSMSKEEALDTICETLGTFGNCRDKVTVSIKSFNNFQSLSAASAPPTCRDNAKKGKGVADFDLGDPRDIMLVQVCFKQRLLSPALTINLSRGSGGVSNLVSTEIFRNEPF